MDFELHVVRGRSATQAIKLIDGVNTVGRQDVCQIRIKSSQVSRKHCELFEKKGLLLVKDLASANGTFVNGKKVDGQLVLQLGDELTIGGVKLRVAKRGQPLATAPVSAPAGGARPDTAEVQAVAADDVEFEIDFDDEPAAMEVEIDDAIELDLDDEPATAVPPAPEPVTQAPAKPAAAKPAPTNLKPTPPPAPKAPEPEPAPESEVADEAIADFLLDIKIDEDD